MGVRNGIGAKGLGMNSIAKIKELDGKNAPLKSKAGLSGPPSTRPSRKKYEKGGGNHLRKQ